MQRGLAGHGLGGVHVRGGVVQQHPHRAHQVVLRREVQRELAEIVRDVRVSLRTDGVTLLLVLEIRVSL